MRNLTISAVRAAALSWIAVMRRSTLSKRLLPHRLGITLANLPRQTPYLLAPTDGILPPAPPGHLKLGLAWSGNRLHQVNERRSLALAELEPVLRLPGVTFYSLQVDVPPRDESNLGRFPNLVDLRPRLRDFQDTAAMVAQLDLVLTVDTAVAHLAGALARPTWTLLAQAADWRWLLDRTDTPWYPTMRLFRQTEPGDWRPVVATLAAELIKLGGWPA